MSRAKSFLLNYSSSIVNQTFVLFTHFIIRKYFIDILGVKLLGYNATFSNLLNLLNLTELGIGYAINYKLYEPIANNDSKTISIYLNIYRKFYNKIIIIIFALGIMCIPLLPIVVKEEYKLLPYLIGLFLMQLLQTLSTYIWSYRKIILTTIEKNYIIDNINTFANICIFFAQIFSITIFKSYYLYLGSNILFVILGNLCIYLYVKKHFPQFLEQKYNKSEYLEYYKDIKTELKNVVIVKFGGFVLNSTDFLVISIILGSYYSGVLSNYSMVFISAQNMILIAMNSVQAIIGNCLYTQSKETIFNLIIKYTKIMCFIGTVFCPTSFFLIGDFIKLWLGEEYILSNGVAILYAINVFIMFLSNPIGLLFGSLGYYKYDKNIIILSAISNIILSIMFVYKFGAVGVLFGTNISLIIYWISRLYILHKYYWNDMTNYFKNVIVRIIILILNFMMGYFVNYRINILNFGGFIFKGFILTIFFIIIYFLIVQISKIKTGEK